MKRFNLNTKITSALRKIFLYSPQRREILILARLGGDKYRCFECEGEFWKSDVRVDHIDPATKVTGETDWNEFISRLFCDVSGLQVLCKRCHKEKTDAENEQRKKSS